jgi:chromosome partitioning protein
MGSINKIDFFENLDEFIAIGQEIIESSESIVDDNKVERFYKLKEIADMCGVSSTAIASAEKIGRIPEPQKIGNKRLGHTVSDIREILKAFNLEPKQDDDPTVTVSFATLKGGSWKTTTAFNFTCYCASIGYSVLVVDLDPQATLSMLFGQSPDYKTTIDDTLGPYLIGSEGYDIERFKSEVVRSTRLKGCVDIIPSCSEMQLVEALLTNQMVESRLEGEKEDMLNSFFRLQKILDEVKSDYDIVVLDGTPSLGILPLNIVCASDVSVIPSPTAVNDFCSTITYLRLLRDYVSSVTDFTDIEIPMPSILAVPTKYSANQSTTSVAKWWLLKIREVFGSHCTKSVIQKHDSVIDNCSSLQCSIFETMPGDLGIKRDARDRAMANYSSVFDEILETSIHPLWPSKVALWNKIGKV